MVDKATQHFPPGCCPHCGRRMVRRGGVYLPPIPAAIFDAVEYSKRRGITPEVLADMFFGAKPHSEGRRLVYVHVNRINDFLEPTDVRVLMNPPRVGAYVVTRKQSEPA